jgi:hypothetical protein
MKKLVQQIIILGLLGAWAVIAITSSKSPSDKCTGEWKNFFENSISAEGDPGIENDAKSVVEMYHPGFGNLILR